MKVNQNKEVILVIGSAGGTKITSGVAQGIVFSLLLHQDLKTALDRPRIHHNVSKYDTIKSCYIIL